MLGEVSFFSDSMGIKNETIFEPNLNDLGANLGHVVTSWSRLLYRLLVIAIQIWKNNESQAGRCVWRDFHDFITGGRMHGRVRGKKRLLSNAWVF